MVRGEDLGTSSRARLEGFGAVRGDRVKLITRTSGEHAKDNHCVGISEGDTNLHRRPGRG